MSQAALCNYLNARGAASVLFWSASGSGTRSTLTTWLNSRRWPPRPERRGWHRCSRARARPDPKYFVGSGKAEEIRVCCGGEQADLVLVDQALTPSQERNLEELTGRRVLDRNGLILDIFAQRARSFEGKLQVELAQLSHLATRLVRGWTHLERQKGGIGLRGPGETQLETDRRLIAKRIRTLRAAWRSCDRSATPAAMSGAKCRCPRWRWSAIPTPANRRCSTP